MKTFCEDRIVKERFQAIFMVNNNDDTSKAENRNGFNLTSFFYFKMYFIIV